MPDDIEEESPAVPTDLLELHVELEDAQMTPDQFKEAFGDQVSS
jgi:hypothetical protein